MTTRRVLLWGLPMLFVGLLAFFAIVARGRESQELSFQAMRQKGWTTYLEGFYSGSTRGSPGARNGDMATDMLGRIWVAGSDAGLDGLHVFDGKEWTSQARDSTDMAQIGNCTDLAVGPQGQVWAAGYSVSVFDGQQWRSFRGRDLGLGDLYIQQVEVDSNGRIWIATDRKGVEQVAEVIVQQDQATATFSHPEFTITDGAIRSLDADNQGRIWAAVSSGMWAAEEWVGLNVFDGETWRRVPDQGINLQNVVRTVFDDQGRAWVATACGGVMVYDGKSWATIVDEDTSPNCEIGPQAIRGITLDHQGRLWAWYDDRVQLLSGTEWVTLTPENSGMAGSASGGANVFGLVVDDQDRIWIGSSHGVSSATIQDALPLPEEVLNQHRSSASLEKSTVGMNWFLPSVVAILWLAAYLELLPGGLVAVALGLISALLFGVAGGVLGTLPGALGGMIGGWIDKRLLGTKSPRWAIGLAVAGWTAGIGVLFLLMRIPWT